jgi:sulfur transfer complex TusBCD TusB component (DsrH family)
VRQGGLLPEEQAVLGSATARLARDGIEVVTILLGTASHDVERSSSDPGVLAGPCWVLADDLEGRGICPHPDRSVRVMSTEEFVDEVMGAEKVIQFP